MEDEYESLPPDASIYAKMIAGGIAGIMEHSLMYPLDSVKTRMQSLNPNPNARYRSIPEALLKMVRHEGILRPVRGMSVVIMGAGPAHALYFPSLEHINRVISGTEQGNVFSQFFAGAVLTVVHDTIMNPAEVVKQRMQIYNSPYRTCSDCFCKVLKKEGTCAFYRSYKIQVLSNIPFHGVRFVTYEFCMKKLNPERTYNPVAHMESGAIAGAFAAAVSTPLDVCRTLLNTQDQQALYLTKQTQINGLKNVALLIYRCNGVKGYFRGLQARVLYQAPATGIAWSVYEFFKYILSSNHKPTHHSSKQEHNLLSSRASSIENQISSKSV